MVKNAKPRRKSFGELLNLKGVFVISDKEIEEARRRKRSGTWP